MEKVVKVVPKTLEQLEKKIKEVKEVYLNRQKLNKDIKEANKVRLYANEDKLDESRKELTALTFEIELIKYKNRVDNFTYENGVLDLGDTIIRIEPDSTIKLRVENQKILIDAYKPGTKATVKHEIGTFRVFNGNSYEKDIIVRDITMAKLRELLFK